MKQFAIVLLAAVAIVTGWMFYRGTDRTESKPRPTLQQRQRPKNVRPQTKPKGQTRKVDTPDGTVEVFIPDNVLEDRESSAALTMAGFSWRELTTEADYVPLEDAWSVDLAGVDYDAEVLVAFTTKSGKAIQITQNDWRRYSSLSLGGPLLQSSLMAAHARAVAAEYDMPYGMTDSQWEAFKVLEAEDRGMPSMEDYRRALRELYQVDLDAAERVRRNAVEGLMAFFPAVQRPQELPPLVRATVNEEKDPTIQMEIVGQLAMAREDLDDQENLERVLSMHYITSMYMGRARPIFELRSTWSYLDEEMPEDAVLACVTESFELTEGTATPPWLRPGAVEYVLVDDVWPHLPILSPPRRLAMLRELVWLVAIRAELADLESPLTPEDRWNVHLGEEQMASGLPLAFARMATGLAAFPTPYHYRAFNGVMWAFATAQPADWTSDENLRQYYSRNRVFCEQWSPGVEVITIPSYRVADGFRVDWDEARKEADAVREEVLAGDVEFSTIRARKHTELLEKLRTAGYDASAAAVDSIAGSGVMAGRTNELARGFGETEFSRLIDGVSLTRNAVCRLDRGQPSPVWRTPRACIILRIIGVRAVELEGDYEDYREQTRQDYTMYHFRTWCTEVLQGLQLAG